MNSEILALHKQQKNDFIQFYLKVEYYEQYEITNKNLNDRLEQLYQKLEDIKLANDYKEEKMRYQLIYDDGKLIYEKW